jgi:predicted DCC family thiol-disulfide oxidoreductase YuxK
MPTNELPKSVTVLFDADCGFCQACVDWLTPRLRVPRPVFVPLDSTEGRALVGRGSRQDSVVRVEAGNCLTKSDAVVALLADCSFPWNLARVGRWIPRRWRDGLYDLAARNRHRLPGSRCRLD